MSKYLTEEQRAAKAKQRTYFDLYVDKENAQLKADLASVGFTRVKMWPQAHNIYYADGEDYMVKMGDGWLKTHMTMGGLSEDLKPKLRAECIDLWNKESGSDTTDLISWENLVILAFKE